MIEIAVALATAEAAVAGIKKAIQIGKDAKECLGDFMALFDAQDQIQKASTEERAKLPPEKQKSAMSEALETVIAAKKIREMTPEQREALITAIMRYEGYPKGGTVKMDNKQWTSRPMP